MRTILFRNRAEDVVMWPGSKSWEAGFEGGSYEFLNDGVALINAGARLPLLRNWDHSGDGQTASQCG